MGKPEGFEPPDSSERLSSPVMTKRIQALRTMLKPSGLVVGLLACALAHASPPVADSPVSSLGETAAAAGPAPVREELAIADCTTLQPAVTTAARYPLSALQLLKEGWVKMAFDLTHTGNIENIRVVAAQPAEVFNEAAITALAQWSYKANPGLRDCEQTIQFEID